MFQVIGDEIYYDGRVLAVITAPLSGWRMDALDAIGLIEHYSAREVADIIREIKAGVNQVVNDALTAADDAVWINDAQHDWIKDALEGGIDAKLSVTWNAWRAI